jgi:hypothetical protein
MAAQITTHVRRLKDGYAGYVQIVDGPMRRSASTHITRLTRTDAKHDAEVLKRDINACHKA